jgi:hypothetical protein
MVLQFSHSIACAGVGYGIAINETITADVRNVLRMVFPYQCAVRNAVMSLPGTPSGNSATTLPATEMT